MLWKRSWKRLNVSNATTCSRVSSSSYTPLPHHTIWISVGVTRIFENERMIFVKNGRAVDLKSVCMVLGACLDGFWTCNNSTPHISFARAFSVREALFITSVGTRAKHRILEPVRLTLCSFLVCNNHFRSIFECLVRA